MVIANSPDIFQHKMNGFFHGFEYICGYMHDLLIMTKRDWTDHVHKLKFTPPEMKVKVLKYNNVKSFFGKN